MREKSKNLKFKGSFINDILNDDSPPPPEIIKKGILPEKSICLIGAPPKSFKTMFTLNLSISLAAGMSFSIFEIERPYKVFYIQSEMAYYATRDERLRPMFSRKEINAKSCRNRLYITKPMILNITDTKYFSKLKNKIQELKSDIVVFDPLVSYHSKDENSNDAMQRVMERFRALTELCDVSVVLVHHSNKSHDYSGGDKIRGASSIFGAIDTYISLTKSGIMDVKMNFVKKYGKPIDEQLFRLNPNTCWLEKMEYTNRKTIRDSFILQKVKENNGIEKVTLRDEIMEKFGVSDKTAYQWIENLINIGNIITDGKDRNPQIMIDRNEK